MVYLVIGTIMGTICAFVASSKGRSVVGWFVLGFLFGLVPLIIVACLPNVKEQKAREQYVEQEQHRLREQLRQERLKNEAFRRYSIERLDAHDGALGVDTRRREALPGPAEGGGSLEDALASLTSDNNPPAAESPLAAAEPAPPAPRISSSANVWYCEINGQQMGPVSALEIKRLLEAGKLQATSLVWTEGLSDWTPVSKIKLFRSQVAM